MPDWFHASVPVLALLLVGCPTYKEIGDKPSEVDDGSGGGSESSSGEASSDASSEESGDTAPGDGPVDCATIDADADTLAGGPLGALGFPPPCSPRASDSSMFTCCSDDPAAAGGNLPEYLGKGIGGDTPIFSALNNNLGTSGVCVRTSDIPAGSGLLELETNCPIPCNPTWDAGSITTVCGGGRVCCQTQALEPTDCVLDGDLWRPVTGQDIPDKSNWAPDLHATHQDPGGIGCEEFAGGDVASEAFNDCVAQLTVADQRGYCMALTPGQTCPADAPTFIDACTQINMGLIPPPE